MQTNKGTGTKTRTIKIDGDLFQVRYISCGKAKCKTCGEGTGHRAIYRDTGQRGGKRWAYFGTQLPDSDPDYVIPTCKHAGCDNPTPRRGQKFCSARCRVAANRAKNRTA